MEYTEEQRQQARAELARRELARRQQAAPQAPEEDAGAYLDNLPPAEGSHPFRDILIGLTHMGRNLHNLPHDLVEGFEHGTKGIGQAFNVLPGSNMTKENSLSSHLPYDPNNYADVFGQKGEGTMLDNIIQKGVEYAPEIAGGRALLRGGFRRLKGTHQLDAVQRAATQPNAPSFRYSPETIEEARNYLPPSHATDEMLSAVRRGEYTPAFGMQSQIGHHQRNLANSSLAAERLLAPRVGELKQTMIGELQHIMRENGLEREAELLGSGINNYRQYVRVRDALLPVMKKLKIPTTILGALTVGYAGSKKLMKY